MTAKEKVKNIHQRILAVMAEVDYVAKGDRKVNNQYTFVGHDAVTARLHPMFVKHGIAVVPTVTSTNQDGNRTEICLSTTFINADDPKDTVHVGMVGYGIDPQDKGPGKAISYAYKYALLKLFALETGDDPEKDLIDHKPAEDVWGGPLAKTKLKTAVREFDTKLRACTTRDEIDVLVEEYTEVIDQTERDMPSWWKGSNDVEGLEARLQSALRAVENEPVPPVRLDVGVTEAGEPDWGGWAEVLVKCLEGCQNGEEISAWVKKNDAPLSNLSGADEDLYKRVKAHVTKLRGNLSQAPLE